MPVFEGQEEGEKKPFLVLTRAVNEKIFIGDNIEVVVREIKGSRVKIGISCPKDIPIIRDNAKKTTR